MLRLREALETHQIKIYLITVLLASAAALTVSGTSVLEAAINPALGVMLFVTFLQVPLSQLGKALTNVRLLAALLAANFVVVPLIVWGLAQFLPTQPLLILGVLFVLLTPCVDYVVTFSHLGRADAHSLLATTPVLLLAQMALLPAYLGIMIGGDAATLVKPGPFIHAFVILIAIPLALAALAQFLARSNRAAEKAVSFLGLLPVPSTAIVLFVVIASVLPQLGLATSSVIRAVPIYLAFAVIAPAAGWLVGSILSLPVAQRRTVAFSAATRNSLVILPLALAVPGAFPVVPSVIVAQTLVELVSSLIYIRIMPKLGARHD